MADVVKAGGLALDADGLTEKRARLLQGVLRGMTIPEASLAAGYSHETGGYQAVASPAFQAALHKARDRSLKGATANIAALGMAELCGASTPAGTRFLACKWVLEHAGHRQAELGEPGEAPLHEQTLDQLRQTVAKFQRIIDEGGDPPEMRLIGEGSAQPGHILNGESVVNA